MSHDLKDTATSITRPATIYDVAKRAGVSHQTVTRVLRDYPGIRPATRERVTEALSALDYRPNLTARLLTTGEGRRIAAFTHELHQYGPSKVLQGATTIARDAGYWLDVVTLNVSNPDEISRAIDTMRQPDLAGILALSSTDEMTRAFEAAEFGVPAVINAEERLHPNRGTAKPTLMEEILGHLITLGHRDFLHIAGPRSWTAARNRRRDFRGAAEMLGVRTADMTEGDWSAESGYRATINYLDSHPRSGSRVGITAIVAANDQMALGAMLALSEAGFRIPHDVSVTGMDDIPDAAFFRPPLTTMRLDPEAQGRTACARLLSKINQDISFESVDAEPQLIVRASTGQAPQR